jgi:hypothetical protein
MQPASGEDIAATCAALRERGPYPEAIARGLGANDPDQMRAAVTHLIEKGRVAGLRDLVERFRDKSDFGVWARVTSATLHRGQDDFAAALADIDDLMARFPARAAPHWWIARARALEGLGRGDEAAQAVREGIARFPAAAALHAFLAHLFSRLKRPHDALAAWREAHARFPEPEASWFAGLANALAEVGRLDEALTIWETSAARFGGDAAIEIGAARTLVRLDRPAQALARLDALLAREPGHVAAARERAALAIELGDAVLARAILTRLTDAEPEAARAEWWAARARAEHDAGDLAAGAGTLAELERRFPKSALAERERLRLARRQERGLDDLNALISRARQRFPDDPDLRSQWVWLLLGQGRLAEAQAHVEALEAQGAPGFALSARLKLEADRGDGPFRAYTQKLAAARDFDLADAYEFARALLDVRAPWAFDLGAAVLDAAAARDPGQIRATLLRIRLRIAARRDEAALALIDALPEPYIRRDVLELRAWAAAKRGRDGEAKALWAQAIAANYYPALHFPVAGLTRLSPEDRPGPEAGPTAFVVFRNEAAQIADFLGHHRRLGVRRFVWFDHRSTDGGRALALAEPDVILYDAPDSYQLSWSGRRWINEIVAREGARGWGLQLDMDERLVYPGCETLPLTRLIAYLDARGFEAVRGYMLDLFAPRLVDDSGAAPPFAEQRFYDDDYYTFGLDRPPYLSPGGGVRARLFEAKEYLHKVPLWRLDAGRIVNSHETTHMRFADVSAALLHYKLMNVAVRGRDLGPEHAGTAYLEADADVEAIRRHSRYAARLARLWRADLRLPGVSRALEDSLTLANRGLMEASEEYRAWMAGRT